jgi:carboxymethylenebutenolidase
MGGRLAFTAAALCDVEAAICCYGGGIAGQLDLAARIQCPMQFHHAGHDAGHDASIPPEAVASIEAAMAAVPAGAQAEFHQYADAQHGFNCWARSAHHPASAARAPGRSLDFLAQLF